jgi:hypothetical protein
MNGYEKSVALNLTGTDAEKVAILQTLTTTDIIGTKLGKWLGERQLLSWDGSAWFGLLQTLIDDGTITGAALAGIRELKAVLVGPRGDGLETTSPIWAPIVFQTISGIAQVSSDAAAMIDSFYALDGGRPYKDLTVEQFATHRTAAENEAAATAGRSERRALYDAFENAIGTNEQAEKIAEMRTMLEALEAG